MQVPAPPAFVLKAVIADAAGPALRFAAWKTMYGGRRIAAGDRVFLFARDGVDGLLARGVVAEAAAVARLHGVARQTPRVDVAIVQLEPAARQLGRAELRAFARHSDAGPPFELDFKLYRQATDKIVGVTAGAAAFLDGFFLP